MAVTKVGEIRCMCGKLLATGSITDGEIELKCKCGKITKISKSIKNGCRPFQERMGLQTKQHDDGLSGELKRVQ